MSGDPPHWWPSQWQMGQFPTVCCAPQPVYGPAFIATLTSPTPWRLSDDDVERIAMRVVELMREPAKP